MEILTLTKCYHYWDFIFDYMPLLIYINYQLIFRSNDIIDFINTDYPLTAKAWKNHTMTTVTHSIISLISLSKIMYPEQWIYIL